MEQTNNSQHRRMEYVVRCPKDLACYKTNHIGSDNLFECLSENPQKCVFSSCHMHGYLCKCPVRIYIVENFRMQAK
jgi:hypothetical protein